MSHDLTADSVEEAAAKLDNLERLLGLPDGQCRGPVSVTLQLAPIEPESISDRAERLASRLARYDGSPR